MISIYTIRQNLADVKGHLFDGDLKGSKNVFEKLEDDITEVLDFLDECSSIQK